LRSLPLLSDSAAAADVIITVTLVYQLQKSKTGLLQTNSVLNRLIELIISTNSLTALIAVIDAVLFGVSSSSWVSRSSFRQNRSDRKLT
jgi:hypothetical protein